ncbi:hypothetical protein [Treponema endosymbiont of Eucomonympha sp.]|uniref:hypothetical protein n=1 Tax=Treponema endosymbiont of Eucomonympha sp. TaxID=1580831 RepID=UPI0013968ADD|nr:hypothetical protein [Treponema endosymbiont of Eucomonympha sp.]
MNFNPAVQDLSLTLPDYSLELPKRSLELQDCSLAIQDCNLEVQDCSLEVPDYSLAAQKAAALVSAFGHTKGTTSFPAFFAFFQCTQKHAVCSR